MELMIGVVIMGIALSCFYSALQQGFYMIENSRDINRVSQVLQDEMERLRTMSWYEIGELPESVDFPANWVWIFLKFQEAAPVGAFLKTTLSVSTARAVAAAP